MTAGIDTGAYLFLQQIDMMAFVGTDEKNCQEMYAEKYIEQY